MKQSRAGTGALRHVVAIASTAVALLAIAAGPALAATGYQTVGRGFTLPAGVAHTHVRLDIRTTDVAPQSGTNVEVRLGAGEGSASFLLTFLQEAGTAMGARELKLSSFGEFRNPTGAGCTFMPESGDYGQLTCRRAGYDWTTDRYYRVTVMRGNHTADGWLWTFKVADLKAGTPAVTIVSFRSPLGLLSASDGLVYLHTNIADCTAVNRLEALINKPMSNGTAATWQSPPEMFREGCAGTHLAAPINSTTGATRLVIAP